MIKKTLLISFLIGFSCFVVAQNYYAENAFWECLSEYYAASGINLDEEVDALENYFVEENVLESNAGESYYRLLKSIEETGTIAFDLNYYWFDTLEMHSVIKEKNIEMPICAKAFDHYRSTFPYKQSKVGKFEYSQNKIFSSDNVYNEEIAKTICDVLSPIDFEHRFYKMNILMFIMTYNELDTGLARRLPPMPEEQENNLNECYVLTVFVSSDNDSVLVNSKKVLIEEVSGIAQNYILGDVEGAFKLERKLIDVDLIGECYQSQLVISLQNDRAASYQTYIEVQNQLVKAYNDVRDKKSMEYFGEKYDYLNEQQQKAIKELVPQRLSEAENQR